MTVVPSLVDIAYLSATVEKYALLFEDASIEVSSDRCSTVFSRTCVGLGV